MAFNYENSISKASEIAEIFKRELKNSYNYFAEKSAQEEDYDGEEINEKYFLNCYEDDWDALVEELGGYNEFPDGDFKAGAEKVVFIPDKEDFVVKFLLGVGIEYEPNVYEEAVKAGVSDYFLPCYFGGQILFGDVSITWTIQEKFSPSAEDEYIFSKVQYCSKDLKLSKKRLRSYQHYENDALATALAVLMPSDGPKFFSFLGGSSINDLHDENWGIMNKKIKLFDYAGY